MPTPSTDTGGVQTLGSIAGISTNADDGTTVIQKLPCKCCSKGVFVPCVPCPGGLPTRLYLTVIGSCLDGITIPINYNPSSNGWSGSFGPGWFGPPFPRPAAIASCCGRDVFKIDGGMHCVTSGAGGCTNTGVLISIANMNWDKFSNPYTGCNNFPGTAGGSCGNYGGGNIQPTAINCDTVSASLSTYFFSIGDGFGPNDKCLTCLSLVPVTLVISP